MAVFGVVVSQMCLNSLSVMTKTQNEAISYFLRICLMPLTFRKKAFTITSVMSFVNVTLKQSKKVKQSGHTRSG